MSNYFFSFPLKIWNGGALLAAVNCYQWLRELKGSASKFYLTHFTVGMSKFIKVEAFSIFLRKKSNNLIFTA